MELSPYTTETERFAISYLERYEAMIQAQDVEDQATIAHLRPIFQTVQRLGGGNGDDSKLASPTYQTPAQDHQQPSLVQDTSFTANHEDTFLNPPGKGNKLTTREISVDALIMNNSHASSTVLEDRVSYQTIRCFMEKPILLSISDAKDYEVLQTDEQLCMVLGKIVEEYPAPDRGSGSVLDFEEEKTFGISFAEFVHLYKTAVSGMQALQMLTGKDVLSGDDRERTKKRTLLMIRSFSKMDCMSFARVNDSITTIVSDDDVIINTNKADTDDDGDGYGDFNDNASGAAGVGEDTGDDDEYDEIVDETTKKEAMISNGLKILAMAREKSEEIEALNEKIRLGKIKLLMSSILCLFLFAAGVGYYIKEQMHAGKDRGEPISTELPSVTSREPLMVNSVCSSNSVDDSGDTLVETEEKLALALGELGTMVLAMSKKEEDLSRCLAKNASCEPPKKCDPCDKTKLVSDSLSVHNEMKDNPKLRSLVIRRQVFAAVGAVIITSLPALSPIQGVLRRILSLLQLVKKG